MKKLLALLLIAPLVANAQIYKWQDSSGEWHFSDTPVAGAQKVKEHDPQMYQTPSPARAQQPDAQTEKPAPAKAFLYKSVDIVTPANEATFRDDQGNVPVRVRTTPELREGDKVILFLDGQPYAAPQDSLSFQLMNVERGAHTLVVKVIDIVGNPLKQSASTTFYMHRTFVKH